MATIQTVCKPAVKAAVDTSVKAQPIPIQAFLEEGPLKVTDLRDTFPLADLMGTMKDDGPNVMRLQTIDASHYPNPECIKPYEPAYKRYRGTVACGDEVRSDVPVFFKLTSVLDPNSLVAGRYHSAVTTSSAPKDATESIQGFTPSLTTRARHQKEQFVQNTAYTDSVASYLTSKLVEDGTCPHFPRLYGVYTGKAQKHYVEFTEEYYEHRRQTAFREGVRYAQWRMVPQPGPASDSGSECDVDIGDDLLGSFGLGGSDEPDFGAFMKHLATKGLHGKDNDESDTDEDEGVDGDTDGDTDAAPPVDVGAMLQTLKGAFGSDDDEIKCEDNASSGASSVLTNDIDRIVDVDTCTTVALDELESIPVGTDAEVVDEEGASGGTSVVVGGGPTEGGEAQGGLTALDGFADLMVSDTNLLMDGDFLTHLETIDAPLAATGSRGYDDQPLYLEMVNVPVQVVAMEAFDNVMEDHLREDFSEVRRCELLVAREESNVITANVCAYRWLLRWRTRAMERKWTALLCQICMALVVMQHRYQMVHNDLHAQNVLLEETALTHLLYRVDGVYYRVPTYGYVVKIIDMGRTTYQLRNTVYMPDVFQPKGEAGEQYTYIHAKASGCGTGTEGEADVAPNPAFDLSRLACSLIDEFYGGADPYTPNTRGITIPADLPELDGESKDDWLFEGQKRTVSPLYNLLCEWIADCYHEPVNRYENFDLYKKIARQMHGTLPIAQLRRPHFAQYTTMDNTVRTNEAFYDLTAVASEAFVPKVHTDGYHSDSEVPIAKAKIGDDKYRSNAFVDPWNSSESGDSDGDEASPWYADEEMGSSPFEPDAGVDQSPASLFKELLDSQSTISDAREEQGKGHKGSRRRPTTTPAQTY